jgi:hypothetical protein
MAQMEVEDTQGLSILQPRDKGGPGWGEVERVERSRLARSV